MAEGIILGDAAEAAVQEYTPQLTGAGEEKVVAVYNPLPHPFRVAFSRPTAYQQTPDPNRQFAREKGLPLDKASPKSFATQEVVLPAGEIKNLPGDIAQIAVRKLITAIIQTRNDDGSYDFEGRGGNKGMVPDPHRRKEIEAEIIKGVYDATEFFNRPQQTATPQAVTQAQISAMNDPVKEQVNEAKPAPGTGSNYTPAAAVSTGPGQSDTAQSEPTQRPAKAAQSK